MKKQVMKTILYFLETLRSISTGVLCKMRGLQRKNRHWSPLIPFFKVFIGRDWVLAAAGKLFVVACGI